MPLPEPQNGLVISYAYLWRHEQEAGQVEGSKVRPCAIVLVTAAGATGGQTVLVVPVTHSLPADTAQAVELPPRVKQHLRLDDAPSWVVCSEVNMFLWPGYDLRPVPGTPDVYAYGLLPPRLYRQIVDKVLSLRACRLKRD